MSNLTREMKRQYWKKVQDFMVNFGCNEDDAEKLIVSFRRGCRLDGKENLMVYHNNEIDLATNLYAHSLIDWIVSNVHPNELPAMSRRLCTPIPTTKSKTRRAKKKIRA